MDDAELLHSGRLFSTHDAHIGNARVRTVAPDVCGPAGARRWFLHVQGEGGDVPTKGTSTSTRFLAISDFYVAASLKQGP